MVACLPHVTPETHSPHPLHSPDRCWPETNCNTDLWIEMLHAMGAPPEPALTFAARQDFEGDQFGFSKFSPDDLLDLYGLKVQELSLYGPLLDHVMLQMERGRLCLVEVDAFYLPDTGAAAHHKVHGKTTIGINRLDPAARRVEYFHNGGYCAAEGADFDGLFDPPTAGGLPFRPYLEYTTLEPAVPEDAELRRRAAARLARDWERRPRANPIRRFQAVLPHQAAALDRRDPQAFNDYAFHNPRLLGGNFDLLGACLTWLCGDEDPRISQCQAIAETCKAFQFQLARAVARGRFETLAAALEPAAEAWDRLFETEPVRNAA